MFQTNDILKKRVYAFTTDFFIIVLTNYFLMAAFTNLLRTVFFHLPIRAQMFLIQKLTIMSSVTLMSLTFAYFSIFYFVSNGRTMGKTLFGLKVVSAEGEMTLKQSMQRSISYFTCAMMGSFLFALPFIRKDSKSLADLFSNTSVAYDTTSDVLSESVGTEFQLALVKEMDDDHNNFDEYENNKAA